MGPVDAVKNTAKSLYQRVSHPLFGAFLSSWLIVNWKVILLVTMSKKPVEELIDIIQRDHSNINNILWYPLIFSVGFVLVGSWLDVPLTWVTSSADKYRKRVIYEREIELSEMQRSSLLQDPKLRFPYESIEKVLATAIINMTTAEKRAMVTSVRRLIENEDPAYLAAVDLEDGVVARPKPLEREFN